MSLKATPHGLPAKLFHWGFLGVFIYALSKQIDEVEELEDFALLQTEMVFAALFLLILIARFVYMRARPTALPEDTPEQVRFMARAVHLAMYGSIGMIAVSGLLIGGLYWSGIKSGPAMGIVLSLHETAVDVTYVLIAMHVAAALYHRRHDNGIWQSMMPSLRKVPSLRKMP